MINVISMELGPDDVSLLERYPHFRGCYVQASMELGPEDVSLYKRGVRPALYSLRFTVAFSKTASSRLRVLVTTNCLLCETLVMSW